MTGKRLLILGMVAAVVIAVGTTATSLAAGTRFDHLDWSKYADQAYPYAAVRGAPNTGDGDALTGGSSQTRGWVILGIAAGSAVALGGASLTLVRRRRE